MLFFVGLHQPSHAKHVERCMVSANRLRTRKGDFQVSDWMLDSGAFTTITTHGGYPDSPEDYAAQVRRWSQCGNLLAAVAQDYMCEPFVLHITGLTVAEHQRLTIARYDALLAAAPCAYVMPVLQGYAPHEYVQHVRDYGPRLAHGAWVGVGSVCKRNATPDAVEAVLSAIHAARPDLRLHGFGVKLTALRRVLVTNLLYSADSMAWSFAARRNGGDANSVHEALRYVTRVETEQGRDASQLRMFP